MKRDPPKTHKRHSRYEKALCGMPTTRLTDVNEEVTCKSCRLWLPGGERALPNSGDDPV